MSEATELRMRLRDACCPEHALGSRRAFLQHVDRVARVVEVVQARNRNSKGSPGCIPAPGRAQEVEA